MWERLERPWQICIAEAWTASCAGSIPIGAAIFDSTGLLVARGHNRIHASADAASPLAQHRLAHAEMNALLSLDPQIDPRTCTLYSTTEPCPLCMGAIGMMPVHAVHYAARDPTAGSACLLDATPFLRSRAIHIVGPTEPLLEILLVALRVEWRLRTAQGQPGKVIAALQSVVPAGVQLGTELYHYSTIADLRAQGRSAGEMLTMVLAIQARLVGA